MPTVLLYRRGLVIFFALKASRQDNMVTILTPSSSILGPDALSVRLSRLQAQAQDESHRWLHKISLLSSLFSSIAVRSHSTKAYTILLRLRSLSTSAVLPVVSLLWLAPLTRLHLYHLTP